MTDEHKLSQPQVDEGAYKLFHHDVRSFITRRDDHKWARPALIAHFKGLRDDIDACLATLEGKSKTRKDPE